MTDPLPPPYPPQQPQKPARRSPQKRVDGPATGHEGTTTARHVLAPVFDEKPKNG